MGCLELFIQDVYTRLAQVYGFLKKEVEEVCPTIYQNLHSDYGLSYIGKMLAIINIQTKTSCTLNPKEWIRE